MRIILLLYFLYFMTGFSPCFADEKLKAVFLQFEQAFKSNNAEQLKQWLDTHYQLQHSIDIPFKSKKTKHLNKRVLLKTMHLVGSPDKHPNSEANAIDIEEKDENSFCARVVNSRNKKAKFLIKRTFTEHWDRKVCFIRSGDNYKAFAHTLKSKIKKSK